MATSSFYKDDKKKENGRTSIRYYVHELLLTALIPDQDTRERKMRQLMRAFRKDLGIKVQ